MFFAFCFLLMNYYLLVILYVFQAMEIMLDKKQIPVIFLHKFKIGPKAVEATQYQQGIWPRNCWQTDSAVVVQEVLQWRQGH